MDGNPESMDRTTILTVPSGFSKRCRVDCYDPAVYDVIANIGVAKKYGIDQSEENRGVEELFHEFQQLNGNLTLCHSIFSTSCIAHIAGCVVKKLIDEHKPVVSCEECRIALLQEIQTAAEFEDNGLI